ncbi:MAG: hypothetical protein LBG88_00750 [Christensenellaceae bacterium]|jgi:hypothetical protein|nr:hypothetical protein [Christensenellaceae bacterium]
MESGDKVLHKGNDNYADAYSGYKYTRYRPRRGMFIFIVVPIALAILFFVGNLLFGFVNFTRKDSSALALEQVTFYVTLSDTHTNKSDAMRTSTEVKQSGGSGYLVQSGDAWAVIDNIHTDELEAGTPCTTKTANLKLANQGHRELVTTLVGTFKPTFETLCDLLSQYKEKSITASDIIDKARLAYNNLVDLRGELEIIQSESKSPDYALLLGALTKQLFGLNLLWLDTAPANFSHVLKNSASWVIFAYFDLTESLKI